MTAYFVGILVQRFVLHLKKAEDKGKEGYVHTPKVLTLGGVQISYSEVNEFMRMLIADYDRIIPYLWYQLLNSYLGISRELCCYLNQISIYVRKFNPTGVVLQCDRISYRHFQKEKKWIKFL